MDFAVAESALRDLVNLKAGKNGKVRQSGKKSKRGGKSPVGNGKRRVDAKNGTQQGRKFENSKKSRNVTAPPTDSMKFGPCRDFFLSHLGDPYPTTVQKHQILKQSSPDFTLRSLNLWFVNIRRRSKWMDIFKKHAGSKRDAMRDLVARVEAQVAGRPAPNPLPSGAAPPGCKVDQTVVEEVMAMRAIVDMVSREVYGEGWDQILQIRPWTDEEVRAHEERKKATRRNARENKVDGEKRKREREEQKLRRQREREQRKRIEQEAVEGIRAARELHAKLMAMNKRKRTDEEESEGSLKRRRSKDTDLDENLEPKKRKMKVPKFDDMGNPLTKEQRKAIKRAMLAEMQTNPLKRKSPELQDSVPQFTDGNSPSKRRRRDAATFDGFPAPGDTNAPAEAEPMTDLTQLFTLEWASPTSTPAPLPSSQDNPPVAAPRPGYGGFALPSDSQPPATSSEVPPQETVEQPRRFSQQLAAFALESGMFDNQNFELFTADTFPGMEVDVHSANSMPAASDNMFGPGMNGVSDFAGNVSQPLHLNANASVSNSMSVSPIQSQMQTPMQQFATPTQHHVSSFEFAPPDHQSQQSHEPNAYTDASQHSNADSSDMSWINAALEHLPSQHDVARMNNATQFPHGGEFGSQMHPQAGFSAQYTSQHDPQFEARPSTAVSDWHHPVRSDRIPQVQPQQRMPFSSTPSPSTPMPSQQRPIFPQPQPQPQAKPPISQPQTQTQVRSSSQSQPQSKQRALWQTPQSQSSQQRYPTPGPSYQQQQQYHAPPSHSFPAPPTPQYAHQHTPQPQLQQPQPQSYAPTPYSERSPEQHRGPPPPTDTGSYGQRYQSGPYQEPHSQPLASPVEPKLSLKDREAEFARAQEALQAQFRREQEEQLARFMRAQEELRNQLLGSGPNRAS
ncbi:homeobox KN domain protein, partial [Rhizoctonia solani AG-3 Rhs1AP]